MDKHIHNHRCHCGISGGFGVQVRSKRLSVGSLGYPPAMAKSYSTKDIAQLFPNLMDIKDAALRDKVAAVFETLGKVMAVPHRLREGCCRCTCRACHVSICIGTFAATAIGVHKSTSTCGDSIETIKQ